MAVSDARRLKVSEQAREHWGEESAEVLIELVVPAGQDMATKADIEAAVSRMEEYTLRTLLIALTPLSLGMIGLYFTGEPGQQGTAGPPETSSRCDPSAEANGGCSGRIELPAA